MQLKFLIGLTIEEEGRGLRVNTNTHKLKLMTSMETLSAVKLSTYLAHVNSRDQQQREGPTYEFVTA